MKARLRILFVLVFTGCIGVDYLEDPIVGERIEAGPSGVALMPGETVQLTAEYFNKYGVKEDVVIVWASTNTDIITVDEDGLVTAAGIGQASILASYQSAMSKPVNVNVVADENAIATVEVSAPVMALEIGEMTTMTAVVRNIGGEELTGRVVEWFSDDELVVEVDADGVVTAVGNGKAGMYATSEGVISNVFDFIVGTARIAMFESSGGYEAMGTAILRDDGGMVRLELLDDFKTSFALGTFVYLSNTTSGFDTHAGGLEIAQITTNGAHTFDVSGVDPDVELFDYRYVIILCKPARVTFGFADLE
jgi:hypothetical protein